MKKIFPVLLSSALIFSNFGCATDGGDAASNAPDGSNAISNAATPTAISAANEAPAAPDEPVPTFTDANTALAEGNKYLDTNATAKAAEAYKQAVKLNPDLAEAYFQLGIALSLLENERADAQIADPEATPTPAKKAKKEQTAPLTESEKAFEKAIKAYEKVIDKNPKDDVAQFNLGRAYNKLNKDKEAEKALREAAELKPEDAEYQMNFGAILVKLANYDEAVTVLKKAVSLDDTSSQAQELLEKAESGKKRIDFGVKAAQQQMESASRQQQQQKLGRPKAKTDDANTAPAPLTPPSAAPPAPKPTVQ